jgi:hypothetical protein
MKGELKEDYTLDPAVNYSLTGAFVVTNGAKLIIPAGTSIVANASNGAETETYIAVMMGSGYRSKHGRSSRCYAFTQW